MSELNKLAYLILNVLRIKNATTKMSSMTINDLHGEIYSSGYSYSSIQKWVRSLQRWGFVSMGIKEGNCNTFFITPSGIRETERINQEEEKL